MENKTAEEIADNIIDNLLCFGMSLPDRIPNRKLIVTALNVYASLQCAEMKKELEELRGKLDRIGDTKSHDTYVMGRDPQTKKVVFLKTYIYSIQKDEAQRDVKQLQETDQWWSIGAIDCLKIASAPDSDDDDE